jgi:hypothetical protein
MPWSIFQNGPGAAATWADDLLRKIGAPLTPGNEQVIYDWEVSEGGGGAYNPLNQGPVPGHPELTTTGQQYGGGAADFAGWAAGLQGAADYLSMASYLPIREALVSNDPAAARSAIIDSPWAASHYGGGRGFSNAPLPGRKSALPGLGSIDLNPVHWITGGVSSGVSGAVGKFVKDIESLSIVVPIVIAAAGLGVLGLYLMTKGPRRALEERTEDRAAMAAQIAAVAA